MSDEISIRDFSCTYSNAVGVSAEITSGLNLSFPEAYLTREGMVELALAIKRYEGAQYCLLPFCRTVEVDAMGAHINYGNAQTGPRAADPICTSAEDFLALSPIDFSQGRIFEVLEACRILVEAGEHVCLEITGPWTMMQSLMDATKVFKMYRKQPDLTLEIMNKLAGQLLPYVDEARARGVEIITFSDSAGTLNILGPKVMAQVTSSFTHPFIEQLLEHIDDTMVLQLCPKFAYALLDTGLATERIHDLGEKVDFLEALLQLRGTLRMVGQACIKNIGVTIANGKIRELVLN